MPLPIIPLAIGTAVGSLATYLYKDETTRERIKSGASQLSDTVKSFMQRKKDTDVDDAAEAEAQTDNKEENTK